jgi:hypothetical protein
MTLTYRAVPAAERGESYAADPLLRDRWFVKQGNGWPSGFGTYATKREAHRAIKQQLIRDAADRRVEAAQEAKARTLVNPDLFAAFRIMVDAHAALWDAQRDVEHELGFDVDDISSRYDGMLLDYRTGDTDSITEDDLVSFIVDAQGHKD